MNKKDFYCSLCEHYKTMKAPKEFPAKEIVFCEYDIICKNFKNKGIKNEHETEWEIMERKKYKIGILDLSTIVLVILKICGVISWEWKVVLIPFWIAIAIGVLQGVAELLNNY